MRTTLPALLCSAAIAGLCAATPSHAALLLAVEGAPVDGLMINTRGPVQNVISTAWSFDRSYVGIGIEAVVARYSTAAVTGHAWLTTAIGPGTTASAVVAESSFALPYADPVDGNPAPQWLQLFAGLELDAGTYYLTLSSDSGYGGWFRDPGASVTEASGVDRIGDDFSTEQLGIDAQRPYASNFGPQAGDVPLTMLWRMNGREAEAAVPAPASPWLLTLALPAALLSARKRRPTCSVSSTVPERTLP